MVFLLEIYLANTAFVLYKTNQMWNHRAALRLGNGLKERTDIKKLFSISKQSTKWEPPMYINIGATAGIGVPFGGGTETSEVCLRSQANLTDSSSLVNYALTDLPASKNLKVNSYFINTPTDLANFLANNSVTASELPLSLPLRIHEATIPTTQTMYSTRFVLGSDKEEVITYTLRKYHDGPLNTALFAIWLLLTAAVAVDYSEQKERVKALLR